MTTVLLVIHLLLAIALVGTVLLQRSEGGALGIGGGGGGGMGGFMTGRSAANLLTRTTGILAGCFMITSLALAILGSSDQEPQSILEGQPPAATVPAPAPEQPAEPEGPSVPLAP